MPTIVLQPDESTAEDGVIAESAPTSVNPVPVTLLTLADTGGSDKESTLIRFDVSVVPSGSTIDLATLRLENISGPIGGLDFRCARLIPAWLEDQKTWNDYITATVWPGGSGAEGDLDLTDAVTGTAPNDVDLEFAMTALVQDALDDRAGVLSFLIHATGTATTGGVYHSSGSPSKTGRPRLTIEYSVAGPPVGEPTDYRNHPLRRDHTEPKGFDGREIL